MKTPHKYAPNRMDPSPPPAAQPDRRDWHPAKPDTIPEPTFWPASLALAVMLSLWGLASSFIITGIGSGLFVVSLAGWISDIRHERRTQQTGRAGPPG